LADVSLDPPAGVEAEADDEEDEWITLSTVHSAKGLEWHTVFVLGLADGHFPSGYALDSEDSIEEERRLLYVAITRAERNLYLLAPRVVQRRGATGVGQGCRLLDDIADLDERVDRVTPGRTLFSDDARDQTGDGKADARLANILDFFG